MTMDYFSSMGFPPYFIVLLVLLAIWDFTWKLLGTWKAARKGSAAWFIAMSVFSTAGILPILYVYIFSERKHSSRRKVRRKRR
ncbi:MAG: DUF5652 family protein [Nanoarchaeota archaeon]|nr:DUF5652 family protein [Nanoarchaeota archaeon]